MALRLCVACEGGWWVLSSGPVWVASGRGIGVDSREVIMFPGLIRTGTPGQRTGLAVGLRAGSHRLMEL